jgi:glutaryl-CoA dehydrogenase
MIMVTQLKLSKTPVSLPAPKGDFGHVTECRTKVNGKVLKRERALMETKVVPVIAEFWARDSFPLELITGNNHGP